LSPTEWQNVPLIDVTRQENIRVCDNYVIKFTTRSAEKAILRSVMGNISKAIEVALILF
jgi:hypothetical protein